MLFIIPCGIGVEKQYFFKKIPKFSIFFTNLSDGPFYVIIYFTLFYNYYVCDKYRRFAILRHGIVKGEVLLYIEFFLYYIALVIQFYSSLCKIRY